MVNSPFLIIRIAMGYFVRFLRPLIKTNVMGFDIFRETREMFVFLAFISDPKYFLLRLVTCVSTRRKNNIYEGNSRT